MAQDICTAVGGVGLGAGLWNLPISKNKSGAFGAAGDLGSGPVRRDRNVRVPDLIHSGAGRGWLLVVLCRFRLWCLVDGFRRVAVPDQAIALPRSPSARAPTAYHP